MNDIKKAKLKLLIFFLIVLLIAIDYPILDKALKNWFVDYEVGIVERVIDGDTIVVNGTSIRLLGINCPEKGEEYYSEAKEFLESKVLNKLIKIRYEKEDIDLYGRKLRYVFVDNENINLKLVENGLANFYFPSGKDSYYKDFFNAWENCVEEEINLCQSSENVCAKCVKLKELDVKEQKIVFENVCGFNCDLTGWTIKDEGRKKYEFEGFVLKNGVEIVVGDEEDAEKILFWKDESYVWTSTGDTLFLRDNKNKLVLWWSY